jgi:hypothetical protein
MQGTEAAMNADISNIVMTGWALVSFAVLTYGVCLSIMAMNAHPETGIRNFIWPPIRDIGPVELPAKCVIRRNKARRSVTVFLCLQLVGFATIVANASLAGR